MDAPLTDTMLNEHMHLVRSTVARFMRRLPRSVLREDLISAGTLGLYCALRSSDHTCPEMFASYARIRIRGSILDELRRHDWSPRRRRAATPALPSNVIPINEAAAKAIAAPPPAPIQMVGLDDLPETAALSNSDESPLDQVAEKRSHQALHKAMASLPERERDILRMRYFEGHSSKEIACVMQLSEARISQLHARATARLRRFLEEEDADVKLAA